MSEIFSDKGVYTEYSEYNKLRKMAYNGEIINHRILGESLISKIGVVNKVPNTNFVHIREIRFIKVKIK